MEKNLRCSPLLYAFGRPWNSQQPATVCYCLLVNRRDRPQQPLLTALTASRVDTFQPVFKEATHGSTNRPAEVRGMAATTAAVRGRRRHGDPRRPRRSICIPPPPTCASLGVCSLHSHCDRVFQQSDQLSETVSALVPSPKRAASSPMWLQVFPCGCKFVNCGCKFSHVGTSF